MITAAVEIPKIIFESGWLLDDSIAEALKVSLNDVAVAEASDRLGEFQQAWSKFGVPLLKATLEESCLSFIEKDIKAYLICGQIPSQSHPLLINVKYYLSSLQTDPRPVSHFVEVVFHELLHVLLQDNVGKWPTPAIEESGETEFEIIAHLHLMALERRAHEKLGLDPGWLKNWYNSVGENYGKSWNSILDEAIYKKLLLEVRTEFRQAANA